ncbi:unnamed protein product [Phytophthora fragariaefolia]|uniref:Unnamed protein product n=1 Tax=Phytophthora fragariaefolia TaxID=1490495 RepID=A0A9W6Y3Y3_9STRA|nr:unnamed protein product [Phytophthora fragariaefolia]
MVMLSKVVGGFVVFLPLVRACIHDKLAHNVVGSRQFYADTHPQPVDENGTIFQTYESAAADGHYEPIRITPYYDNTTLDRISAEKRAVIYKIIPEVIERFRNALSVVPTQGKLAAQHSCEYMWQSTPPICFSLVENEMCYEMPIPAEHFGATQYCTTCPKSNGCLGGKCAFTDAQGVENTDFLIYIRSVETDDCGDRTLAYASPCQVDQYGRPTFGMANFCPSQISTVPQDYESQVATAMHEVTHALGFSAVLFPYMRYPDGTPRTLRDADGQPPIHEPGICPDGSSVEYYVEPSTDTIQFSTERGHVVAKMVTPNVAAFVKTHFGCDSLTGAEIEQQDGTGCIGSHWEERIFEPEYMTPVISSRNVFSALTLAFFQDSGWYHANLSTAERLHFGENRGCAFATEKCIDPATGISIASDHYCTNNDAESCSVDARSRSVCSVLTGEDIPSDYRYFPSDPTKGGDSYPDYCPINTGYTYGDCSNPSNLQLSGFTKINIMGESYCANCRCTPTTLRSDDSTKWTVNSYRQTGCYAMRCYDNGSNSSSESIVELTIPRSMKYDFVRVNCTAKGKQLSVPGFSGLLTCPDPNVICGSTETFGFVVDLGGSTGTGSVGIGTGTSGTGSSGTGLSGTGSGTANLRSTNAAHYLHPDATISAYLLGLLWLVHSFF